MTLTPVEGPTTNPPDRGHQAVSLTIQEAYTKFQRKFIKVREVHRSTKRQMTKVMQACHGIDMTLLEFLDKVKGVPYYEMRAYIALSSPGEKDEEWGNINACRHFLDKATEALVVCKVTYLLDKEVKMLETYGRNVAQQKANLRGEPEEPAEEEPDWQL
ncbi:hypothetical protein LTR42_010156 [Elasticomyces elasticus]|nr:hypothetical protein LTR42_010156 [Elasticomyces elasticus]